MGASIRRVYSGVPCEYHPTDVWPRIDLQFRSLTFLFRTFCEHRDLQLDNSVETAQSSAFSYRMPLMAGPDTGCVKRIHDLLT